MDSPTLATDLRRLVTTLDGSVDHAYEAYGLAFRAAFTPVTRMFLRHLSPPVGDRRRVRPPAGPSPRCADSASSSRPTVRTVGNGGWG